MGRIRQPANDIVPVTMPVDPEMPDEPEAKQSNEALLRSENERLLAEIQKLKNRDKPLPDTGPGDIRVILRHSPAPVKRWIAEKAANEEAAWKALQDANDAKARTSKYFAALWQRAKNLIATGEYEISFDRKCKRCGLTWTEGGKVCQACEEKAEVLHREKQTREALGMAAAQ